MELITLLQGVPLFRLLSDDQLDLVAGIGEEQVVAPGATLCRQADPGARLFLIESGEAIVHHIDDQGFRRPVGMVRAGKSFGTTSLLLGETRDATITAVTKMRLWTLKRDDFEQLLTQHPKLWRALSIPEEIMAKLRAPHYTWVEPGEIVAYHSRRHWMVFVRWIFVPTLAALALVLSLTAFKSLFPTWPRMTWAHMLILAIYILAFIWGWVDWRNDHFIVSSRRIAHSERSPFRQAREEAPIERVQSVNVRRRLLGGLLGYGDLTITTAAKVGDIHCDRIPHPEKMREAIFAQIARLHATRRAAQRHLIRDELTSRINLESPEPLAGGSSSEQGPIDHVEEIESRQVRPSKLGEVLGRLAAIGVIPRTRIETPESVTWRKHWVFLALSVMPSLLLGIALGIATYLGFSGRPHGLATRLPHYPYVTLFLALLAIARLWWRFADWANDLYIVTRERIIDIEKHPLFFAQERREASLAMIQNVSLRIPNPIARMLHYGYVLVQTAGSGDFTFDGVSNPRAVQREIFQRIESYREMRRKKEASRRRAEIGEWFTVYDSLRHQEGATAHQEATPEEDEARELSGGSADGDETGISPATGEPAGE